MKIFKKLPKASITAIILGIVLIFSGIFFVELIFGSDSYSVTIDRKGFDGVDVKVEINSEKELKSEISVYVDDVHYYVSISEIDNGVYRGSLHLSYDYFMMSESDVYVKCYTQSGMQVSLDREAFGGDVLPILLRVMLIFFGSVAVIIGVTSGVFRKKVADKRLQEALYMENVLNSTIQEVDKKTFKKCEYCGCENDINDRRCKNCNAPLKD